MKKKYFPQIQGLRGIASISVVISHLVASFYPAAYYAKSSQSHFTNAIDVWLAKSPLNFIYNGHFPLIIFFILSGFLLTLKYQREKAKDIPPNGSKVLVKRYARFLLPILISYVISYLFSLFSLFFASQAAVYSQSNWLASQWNFEANLYAFIKQGFFEVFFLQQAGYNPVLWTLRYQFFATILIYSLIYLLPNKKFSILTASVLMLALVNTYYFPYLLAFLMAQLFIWLENANHYNQFKDKIFSFLKIKQKNNKQFLVKSIKFIFLITIIYTASYPPHGVVPSPFYDFLNNPFFDMRILMHTIAASLLMFLLFTSKTLKLMMMSKSLIFLGKISFSLYVIHINIITSLTTFIFILLHQKLGAYHLSVLLSSLITLPIIIGLSYLVYYFVEKKGYSALKKLVKNQLKWS